MNAQKKTQMVLKNTTHHFELFIVLVVFSLAVLRLASFFLIPVEEVIPDEVTLSITLALMVYMWIRELRDRSRLVQLHEGAPNRLQSLARG